jgi:flagellar protein FliJ
MAQSRSQRMQVVLVLAERKEQQAGQQFSQYRAQVDAEKEQLRQLEDYAAQYLNTYSERKTGVRPHELIAYSSFIQRLAEARKDQETRIARMQLNLNRLQQLWQQAYQKRESLKDLIARLQQEENLALDKRLQKELDGLVGQAHSRRTDEA